MKNVRLLWPPAAAKALKGSSRGFSAIEVIVALAILGAVAVTYLLGLSTTLKTVLIADQRSTAQSLAQSQMEDVKIQDYPEDPGSETTYAKIDLIEYPGYSLKGIDWNSAIVEDITGVAWDPENGQPSSTDERIQKVTIIVLYNGAEVLRLADYKVDR